MNFDPFVAELIRLVVALVVTLAILIGSAVILSYGDRKVLGFSQDRLGPYHYGPQGILTPIADTLKLLLKEDVVPARSDKVLHVMAPIVFVMACLGAFAVLPLGDGLVAADLNIGLVYLVAVGSFGVIGVLTAGWSSNNKYSTLGGLRSVGQMISYEVPLVLSLVPPAMLAGTLSLSGIVRAQSEYLWFGMLMPLALLILFICALAETNRNPFDLPEAENEIVAGYLTEYSGIRWAMFFMAEYGNMVVSCALASVLFLGGWQGPLSSSVPWLGPLYMLGKTYFLIFVFLWVRATLPRLRIDQLMSFAWKVLIPLALINIGITGVVAVLLPDAYHIPLAALNWVLFIGFIVALPTLQRRWAARQPRMSYPVKTPGQLADAVRR